MKTMMTLAAVLLSVVGLQAGNNNYNNNNQYYTNTPGNTADDSQYSAAADLTQTDTDHTIAQNIQTAIAQDSSVSHNGKITVQVTVRNGVATLTGTAANEAEKARIATIAKGTSGVTSVNNQLSVGR